MFIMSTLCKLVGMERGQRWKGECSSERGRGRARAVAGGQILSATTKRQSLNHQTKQKKTPNINQRRHTKTNKKMNKNTKTNTVTKIHINTNRHGREYGQIRRESVWKIIQIRT